MLNHGNKTILTDFIGLYAKTKGRALLCPQQKGT